MYIFNSKVILYDFFDSGEVIGLNGMLIIRMKYFFIVFMVLHEKNINSKGCTFFFIVLEHLGF